MNERMNEIVSEAVEKGHKNLKSIPNGFGLDGQMDRGTKSPKDCIY